jgi:hypothetical protein
MAFAMLLLLACEPARPKEPVQSAKFGIFFGGQLQERRDVPFELDPIKQSQGFRVDFGEPLAVDTAVDWEIAVPQVGPQDKKRSRGGAGPREVARTVTTGTDIARAGTSRFDHVMPFRPGDPLGLWNVRVIVRGKVVVDRPVEVFDPAERKRNAPKDGGI